MNIDEPKKKDSLELVWWYICKAIDHMDVVLKVYEWIENNYVHKLEYVRDKLYYLLNVLYEAESLENEVMEDSK